MIPPKKVDTYKKNTYKYCEDYIYLWGHVSNRHFISTGLPGLQPGISG